MKTTAKLLCIILLAMPQTMRSQRYEGAIGKAFEKVLNTKGVNHSTIKDEHRESSGGAEEKTLIHSISVGRSHFNVFDELKSAFLADEELKTSVYTCFGPLEDSYRQLWAVKLKRGGDFHVGEKSKSSYAIATFDDPQHKGYRTVYTAEWWDTDDKNVRQGVLLVSYGEKPAMHSYSAQTNWSSNPKLMAQVSKLEEMQKLWPSMASADSLMKVRLPISKADFATNPSGWARQAMSNASRLDGADWLRLFSMLTQQMLDRADKTSTQDLVVVTGVLLDMCKQPTGVDREERDICAARLKEIATQLQSRSQYAHDLLMLAAKRLQKK